MADCLDLERIARRRAVSAKNPAPGGYGDENQQQGRDDRPYDFQPQVAVNLLGNALTRLFPESHDRDNQEPENNHKNPDVDPGHQPVKALNDPGGIRLGINGGLNSAAEAPGKEESRPPRGEQRRRSGSNSAVAHFLLLADSEDFRPLPCRQLLRRSLCPLEPCTGRDFPVPMDSICTLPAPRPARGHRGRAQPLPIRPPNCVLSLRLLRVHSS